MHAHKLVIGFWLLIISLFITPAAFAQASTPSAIPATVSPTSPIYTDLLIHNMFHTFSCLAVGQSVIGQPCLNYVKGVPVLSRANFSGGTLGAITGLIGGLYQNPPVRTYESLASLGETLGLVKEAKAQGVVGSGAGVLQPIQALWQVSRNISYVIMIVIFVVIGLMVMFRQKINPQTVITAQAAIPGLVIGLILITFSYFLAGLISDTAFIGTNLVGAYFSAVKGKEPENLVEKISPESVISIFSKFVGIVNAGNASAALDNIWEDLDGSVKAWLRTIAAFISFQYSYSSAQVFQAIPAVGQGIQAAIGIVGASAAVIHPPGTLGIVLAFVAMLVLLYAMFRLLLRLINSFLTIIFLTISAPFQFLWASLPGRQGIATEWILNMLGNVLAFPAVLAVFYFVAFLLGQNFGPLTVSGLNQTQTNNLIPIAYAQGKIDIVGSTVFPLFGGMDLGFIRILVAFGALIVLPTIPDIIIRTVSKASQAGQLIGQEIGTGIGGGRRYAGQFQQGLGTIGERTGGLYTKRGLQEFYHPGEGMKLMETRTPGQIELLKRKFGGFKGFIRGNKPP